MNKNISHAAISLLATASLEAKDQKTDSISHVLDHLELQPHNTKSSIIDKIKSSTSSLNREKCDPSYSKTQYIQVHLKGP